MKSMNRVAHYCKGCKRYIGALEAHGTLMCPLCSSEQVIVIDLDKASEGTDIFPDISERG